MIWQQIIYVNRINKHFWEGTFAEGIRTIPEVERYIRDYGTELDIHHRMVLCYKIACLYFGHGDYRKCMDYLGRIISTRDPRIHRDLQCYARILNLIASYEAGIDYNLDYQVRSVCLFLVKMNDMHQVQQEIMAFLKRLNSMYATNLKEELRQLYERLKPLEHHRSNAGRFITSTFCRGSRANKRGVRSPRSFAGGFSKRTAGNSRHEKCGRRKTPSQRAC